MKKLIYVSILTAALHYPALAAQMTIGDLLKICTSPDDGDKVGCRFYILGVTEGFSLGSGATLDSSGVFHELKDKPVCVPEDISGKALELVVKMSMGEDLAVFPKDREMPAVSFLAGVMRSKFPCGKPKTP